jgi:hypothetical protein
MKLLGKFISLSAFVTFWLVSVQEPNSKNGSNNSINPEFLGTWYLSESATKALWPSEQAMDDFAIEFGESSKKLAILSQDTSPILASNYWTRKTVSVADFMVEFPGSEDKLSLQFVLLGVAEEARLFASLIQKGASIGYFSLTKTSPVEGQEAGKGSKFQGYWTKIESADDGIVKLTNGAIVEITRGYLGYVGYGKKAFLHSSGTRLWVEGKKSFAVTSLRDPSFGSPKKFEKKTISKAADDGSVFIFYDGTSYVVPFATFTGGYSDYEGCFVVDGYILLFESGEMIDSGRMH